MNYERFVRLRRPVWDELDAQLGCLRRGEAMDYRELERLALLYRQVMHDHAWARSHLPGTGVARRLAQLTVEGTHLLQGRQRSVWKSLGRFFRQTFPAAARRHLPAAGVCLALFLVAALFGFFGALIDPAVTSALLPDDALAGLEEGRLWTESLTTTMPPAMSSSAIATNNMSVALTAFALGALFGLGALWVVLLNGYMLGAVLGGTLRFAMAGELLEFVAAHGPLEITLILVAAGVGLRVGASWFLASDRPRAEVMAAAGRDGVVVILGCLPWFAVLGLVEAVVSPAPALALGLKVALGWVLLALFLAWVFSGASGEERRPAMVGRDREANRDPIGSKPFPRMHVRRES